MARPSPSRSASAALRTGPRSGSFESVIGVGTQTKIASASARRASAGDGDPEALAERRAEPLVADVVDRRGPARAARPPAPALASTPTTWSTGLLERDRERQADVAEPDDGDARVAAHADPPAAHGGVRPMGSAARGGTAEV